MTTNTIPDATDLEIKGAAVEEVLRVMDVMERAWSDKNLPELFKHYWQDDGFVLFTSRGANYGWNAAKQMLEQYFDDLDEILLRFGSRKVRIFGGVATVVYEWRTEGRSKKDGRLLLREGYGTDVFLRQGGDWKLYHNHASIAPPGSGKMMEHPW